MPIIVPEDQLDFELAALKLLDKDTKAAAKQLNRAGARQLVDTYYRTQKMRIVMNNQIAAASRMAFRLDRRVGSHRSRIAS